MYRDYLKRKEKIIITAIDVLDELGMHGLTTKEIANRHGITEPAIYRQFKGKQEILVAIIDRFSMYDEQIKNTIIQQNMDAKASILYFIESYGLYYQSYDEITTVMFSFGLFRYKEETNEQMINIMKNKKDFIKEIMLKGIEEKLFKKDIDSDEISEMILGIFLSSVYLWKIEDCKEDLTKKLKTKINLILDKIIMN